MSDTLRAAAQAVADAFPDATGSFRYDVLPPLITALRAELAKPQPEPVAFVFINPIRVEFNPLYPIWKLPLTKNPLYAGDTP